MNIKLFFLKRLGNIAFSLIGFGGGLALAIVGYSWNNPFLIAAGAFAAFQAVVLFWIDAILFAQASKQVFDLAEKATEYLQLQLAESPRTQGQALEGRGVAFLDGETDLSATNQPEAVAGSTRVIPNTQFNQDITFESEHTEASHAGKAVFGSIEIRARSFDVNAVSDLEFIEQVAQDFPFQYGKKRLIVAALGSTLIDEPTLGDFIEGNIAFDRLAFPEIVPGIDLLAAAEISEFRSSRTLREALEIAARGYERTVLIVSENQFAHYQSLFRNRLDTVVQTINHIDK